MDGPQYEGRRRWRPVLLTAGVLLLGTLVPLPPALRRVSDPRGADKVLHLVGHAGLAASLDAALSDDVPWRRACFAVLLSVVFGLVTETAQTIVPGRRFEAGDVAAALVGSVGGVVTRQAWGSVARRERTGRFWALPPYVYLRDDRSPRYR